jgi:hypothetical protein
MICQILRLYLPICRIAMSTNTTARTIIGIYVKTVFLVMGDEPWHSQELKTCIQAGMKNIQQLKTASAKNNPYPKVN